MALLPFVEAVADVCRSEANQGDRFPLAVLAGAYAGLVEKEQVTDPAEVKRLLIAARQAADGFLGTTSQHSLFFSESDDRELTALMRKHGVFGESPETIDRSLWFTPEHIGSEVAIRSIVYSLEDLWTPLASGEMPGSTEEVAKARNRLTTFLLQLKQEGADAGLKTEASAMLLEALSAFHRGEIRKPGVPARAPMPSWLYDMQVKLLTQPT